MTLEEDIDKLMEKNIWRELGSTSDHTSSSDGEVSDGQAMMKHPPNAQVLNNNLALCVVVFSH